MADISVRSPNPTVWKKPCSATPSRRYLIEVILVQSSWVWNKMNETSDLKHFTRSTHRVCSESGASVGSDRFCLLTDRHGSCSDMLTCDFHPDWSSALSESLDGGSWQPARSQSESWAWSSQNQRTGRSDPLQTWRELQKQDIRKVQLLFYK